MTSTVQNRTMIQNINAALHDAMEADANVVVIGEDLNSSGVFGASVGLVDRFGAERVMSTTASAGLTLNLAIGMAREGMRPVVEISFADFSLAAMETLTAELGRLRFRSGGGESCPIVVRMAYGGGIAAGPDLSFSPESFLAHIPGIKVVSTTPDDAAQTIKAALQAADPVIILEPKGLLFEVARGDFAASDGSTPNNLGAAQILRAGTEISCFSYGNSLSAARRAVLLANDHGIDCELINLRSLAPLDDACILNSIRKTGRGLIVHEAPQTNGLGAEVVALIAERAMESLEAPLLRVCGPDTPMPYAGEKHCLPNAERVMAAIEQLLEF